MLSTISLLLIWTFSVKHNVVHAEPSFVTAKEVAEDCNLLGANHGGSFGVKFLRHWFEAPNTCYMIVAYHEIGSDKALGVDFDVGKRTATCDSVALIQGHLAHIYSMDMLRRWDLQHKFHGLNGSKYVNVGLERNETTMEYYWIFDPIDRRKQLKAAVDDVGGRGPIGRLVIDPVLNRTRIQFASKKALTFPVNAYFLCQYAEACLLDLDHGEGDRQIKRYYFDYEQSKCLEFEYHGIGGNANHFTSELECKKDCFRSRLKRGCDNVNMFIHFDKGRDEKVGERKMWMRGAMDRDETCYGLVRLHGQRQFTEVLDYCGHMGPVQGHLAHIRHWHVLQLLLHMHTSLPPSDRERTKSAWIGLERYVDGWKWVYPVDTINESISAVIIPWLHERINYDRSSKRFAQLDFIHKAIINAQFWSSRDNFTYILCQYGPSQQPPETIEMTRTTMDNCIDKLQQCGEYEQLCNLPKVCSQNGRPRRAASTLLLFSKSISNDSSSEIVEQSLTGRRKKRSKSDMISQRCRLQMQFRTWFRTVCSETCQVDSC